MSRTQIEQDVEMLLRRAGEAIAARYDNAADCWALIDELVKRLRATQKAPSDAKDAAPFAWIDVARRIADSGIMDDLPNDYAVSHKQKWQK
ncbi:MAG: hypothetical protein HY22_09740 [[Candidatus Thermochlorobacteriaceae] bacterium GBChlB]|nr:MAG: hypothetical protein HY22_09740 [[Candidatus Thermochlorobacteriaceae] bacterium GBChlB]